MSVTNEVQTDGNPCVLYRIYPKLGIGVLGYLLIDIGVETALGSLWRRVLLCVASSAPVNLSAKCASCSFNSSTHKFMFEYTSPRKLGSVYSNMNSGLLEPESVKFLPFSGELHPQKKIVLDDSNY